MIYPWMAAQWQQWQQLQSRLGHAYLLSAPSGIGIESFVQQVTQSILCNTNNTCGECSGCHLFLTDQHPDFFHLQVLEDKKEISVDQIRELVYKLNETSHQGGYKVAWVEGPEYLNQSAFNALLKTLEEPSEKTLFILTTHQVGRLPATILSRCQKLMFAAPSIDEAQSWLHQACPQADEALLKRALRLNWGAPIAAQQWIEQGLFEQDNEWKAALKQMQSGQKTVPQLVEKWLKWAQPEQVFDYFYFWSVSAVRAAYYKPGAEYSDDQIQNWLRFQQACLQAKNSWQGNANKQLVLEALCFEWLQIQQSQAPLESVFQTNIVKGKLA
ncbi:DNA polymerase III subunit delta' [Thiomicrorhabdus sp. ZW0627]|uniref:DNA polymerase III subunit delta' n=1 Tax=Thiomicrorhabdus sp. ZW0627 TaxID=3039774 RepID=UPI0024369333|nr:DNA polymerase III subunit delta' [Thiomicrorhabdus sp. ZW0627]MDG6774624.1 DNA polymerase III subunit delta' [Thiomicrorhabdus sp. ZW0627]